MKSNMTLKTDNDFAFATAGSGKDNRSNVSYPDHSVDRKKSDIITSKQENNPVTTGTSTTKQTSTTQATTTKSNQQAKGIDNGNRLIPGKLGVVTRGNSTKLGKNMMEEMGLKRSTKWSGYQAQHVIPSEMAKNPIIKKLE